MYDKIRFVSNKQTDRPVLSIIFRSARSELDGQWYLEPQQFGLIFRGNPSKRPKRFVLHVALIYNDV